MIDACSYCGSPDVHMWQGGASVCDDCMGRHAFATWEPNLNPPHLRTTPLGILLAGFLSLLFSWVLCRTVSPLRVIDNNRYAIWVWSNAHWYESVWMDKGDTL